MISSGCGRHSPVYVYISVKGSRACKPCNVLAVRKYVRVVWYKATLVDLPATSGQQSNPSTPLARIVPAVEDYLVCRVVLALLGPGLQ